MARLELWALPEVQGLPKGILDLKHSLPDLQELGMWRSHTRTDLGDDYRLVLSLHNYLQRTSPVPLLSPCLPLNSLPPSLRFLSITNFILTAEDIAHITGLQSLETLLLAGLSMYGLRVESILGSRIRILGFKGVGLETQIANDSLSLMSPSIQISLQPFAPSPSSSTSPSSGSVWRKQLQSIKLMLRSVKPQPSPVSSYASTGSLSGMPAGSISRDGQDLLKQ